MTPDDVVQPTPPFEPGDPAAPWTAGSGATVEDRPIDQQVVVLTGLSGGGKTAAAKLFEDLGYVVVDNLPGELLRDLADLIATEPGRYARTAIVLDIRSGDVPLAFGAMRGALEGRGIRPIIIFLEAREDVLIRRFSETRHRHPLGDERGISASIALERAKLDSVRTQADVVLDTSDLSLRELRERIFTRLGDVQGSDRLSIQLISVGFPAAGRTRLQLFVTTGSSSSRWLWSTNDVIQAPPCLVGRAYGSMTTSAMGRPAS